MSAAAMELSGNAFQPVSIDYHEMMAKSITIQRAVVAGVRHLNFLSVAKDFWSLSGKFANLLAHANEVHQAPEAELSELLEKFKELHSGIDELVDLSRSRGLLNRSLTASSVRSIMSKNDQLLDLMDAWEVSLRAATKESFERAMREFEAGETVSLESLKF